MRSIKFLMLAVLISAGLFTSCSKDETLAEAAPIIQLDNTDGVLIDNGFAFTGKITSEVGLEEVMFSFVRGKDASSFNTVKKFTDKNNYTFREELANVTEDITGIKVLARDKNNKVSEKTLTVTPPSVKPEENPLSEALEFKLGYPASNPSKNPLSKYGVEYNSNTTAITAKFGGGFVMLTKSDYDALKTKQELVKKYQDGSKVTSFTVDSDAKFTAKYFISIENDIYYLIHMTNLQFKAGDNVATFTMRK